MNATERQPTTVGYALARYWWVLAAVTALGAVAAYGLSSTQPTVVPARARVALGELRLPNAVGLDTVLTPLARVEDEALRARSAAVLKSAASSAGISEQKLRESVRIVADQQANAFVVEGKAGTAALSTKYANAVVASYEAEMDRFYNARVEVITGEVQKQLELAEGRFDEASQLLSQLANDSPDRTAVIQRSQLAATDVTTYKKRLTDLAAGSAAYEQGIAFTVKADGPSGKPEPNKRRNVAFGTVLGAILGIGAAWSVADSRHARTAAKESSTDSYPTIKIRRSRRSVIEVVDSGAAGDDRFAYRQLLALASGRSHTTHGRPARIIAVLGAEEGDDSASLGLGVAAMGAIDTGSCLLINGLRRQVPGLEEAPRLVDATSRLPEPATMTLTSAPNGLDVIALGSNDRAASSILTSPTASTLLDAIRAEYELAVVLLDPVVAGSAYLALPSLDAAIVVTSRERLSDDATTFLQACRAPIAAVVNYAARASRSKRS